MSRSHFVPYSQGAKNVGSATTARTSIPRESGSGTAGAGSSGKKGGWGTASSSSMSAPIISEKTIYLKASPWVEKGVFSAQVSQQQEQQVASLRENRDVDPMLRSVASLLELQDLTMICKRLNDLMESHHTRAFIRRRDQSRSVSALAEARGREFEIMYAAQTEDPALTKSRVLSMYYLRFVHTKECKRRILDILNYFRRLGPCSVLCMQFCSPCPPPPHSPRKCLCWFVVLPQSGETHGPGSLPLSREGKGE